MERVPFLFCECPPARVNSKLLSITRDTLKLDMKGIQGCVEARIKHELLDAFGLVLDGWSDGRRHYIAIFAVFFYTTGILPVRDLLPVALPVRRPVPTSVPSAITTTTWTV